MIRGKDFEHRHPGQRVLRTQLQGSATRAGYHAQIDWGRRIGNAHGSGNVARVTQMYDRAINLALS